MVSNSERIRDEIGKEARRMGRTCGLDSEDIVTLIMHIVEQEGMHRVKAVARINQKTGAMIRNVAPVDGAREDA